MRFIQRTRRVGASAVLAVAVFGVLPAQASGHSVEQVEATVHRLQQATDPAAEFERLEPSMQEDVVTYLTPASVSYCEITAEDQAAVDPQDEACYAATMYADNGSDPNGGANAGAETVVGFGDAATSAATKCLGRSGGLTWRNKLNKALFSFSVDFFACYDGTQIVDYAYRIFKPATHMPLWFDRGNSEAQEVGGQGQRFYNTHTVRRFELCIGGKFGCLYQKNIAVDTSIHGTGAWRWTAGG